MFFTFAEVRAAKVCDEWEVRQLAFDTQRRHLYISDKLSGPREVAPPAGCARPVALPDLPLSTDRNGSFSFAVSPPIILDDVTLASRWSMKVLVDKLKDVREQTPADASEGHATEKAPFQMCVLGEKRPLARHEAPSEEPLLCPSTSLRGMPERYSVNNGEFLRDPFFLRELYDSLRREFAELRERHDDPEQRRIRKDRKRTAAGEGERVTLGSPREGGGTTTHSYKDRVPKWSEVSLRFRNAFEYRRFCFVVRTVMGHDKLDHLPFHGMPPYDPRNGLAFAPLPTSVRLSCRPLDNVVLYTFTRGHVVGRTESGDLTVLLRDVFLCIAHDRVVVVTKHCRVARWMWLKDVSRVEYDIRCSTPLLAFLSDQGMPEIVFLPDSPKTVAIDATHSRLCADTVRAVQVLRSVFFESVDVRRAIEIREALETTARAFGSRLETDLGRPLNLGPCAPGALPRETPREAWLRLREARAQQSQHHVDYTAIPLYDGHPNSERFEPELLNALEAHMERGRVTADDVVGVDRRAQDYLQDCVRNGDVEAAMSPSDGELVIRDAPANGAASLQKEESVYGIPGSTYLPRPSSISSPSRKVNAGRPGTPVLQGR